MSTQNENEKVALEGQNGNSSAPSLNSDEEFANPAGIDEKALIRKLDLKLLPPLTLLYLLSFLDRSNSVLSPSLESGSGGGMLTGCEQLEMQSWMD